MNPKAIPEPRQAGGYTKEAFKAMVLQTGVFAERKEAAKTAVPVYEALIARLQGKAK